MEVSASILIALFCAVSTSVGQNNSRAGNDAVEPLPTAQCSFDRTKAVVMRVKKPAPLDFSASLEKPIRLGTVVSVSHRERSWSCVTGSIQTPNGWSTWTGWMQRSQLEELAH
jgi:hypothetical protein